MWNPELARAPTFTGNNALRLLTSDLVCPSTKPASGRECFPVIRGVLHYPV
jgi:hypothetical protein